MNHVTYDWIHDEDFVSSDAIPTNDNLRSHLPQLFAFTLFWQPHSIVELGVQGGWSTLAFSSAAEFLGAKLLGIDMRNYVRSIGRLPRKWMHFLLQVTL